MAKQIKVAVHSGEFHADDSLAVAALCRIADVKVVRTRDEARLVECDLRVDVGAKSDPETGDFDHHQRGGAGARDNGVPFAGFGLVWKRYGTEICGDAEVAQAVDKTLVQSVDAADCGFALCGEARVEGIAPYTISDAVSAMNPAGDELRDYDAAFGRAVEFAASVLDRAMVQARAQVAARRAVAAAISESEDKAVVVFNRYSFDWAGLAAEQSAAALFVLYPSEDGTYWYIQCVPPKSGSFDQRRPLPEAWAGKRGAELAEASGIEGAVFCHPGRFIAGAATLEGARQFAKLACG